MKTFRIVIALALASVLLACAAGCDLSLVGNLTVGSVENATSDKVYLKFALMEGTRRFVLKAEGGESVEYTGTLESGKMEITFVYGERTKTVTVTGEEPLEGGFTAEKGNVMVTFKTDGQCKNGEFTIRLKP
ncbi:MAG: hypothetical protein J6112_10310 [Clostridia bacterium]|nr:hypothetical protein [Clostridia bacterium]